MERTKCAVRTGGLAIAISLGMALAPGVAFAEPDGAGSSASSDSSCAGGGGATDNSDPQPGAGGSNGSDGPNSTPNSQSTQDTSSEINSRLADKLARIDQDETEVEKRRVAVDQDLGVPSKTVELVDREADLLKRQQELAHQAVQQATAGVVAGPGSIGYELQQLQDQSGLTLAQMSAILDMQRAQSLEAAGTGVQQDLASLQAATDLQAAADMMRLTSAEMESFLADIAAAPNRATLNAAAGNRG